MTSDLQRWLNLLTGLLFAVAGVGLGWVFRSELSGEPLIAALFVLWLLAGVVLLVVGIRGSLSIAGFELLGGSVRGIVDVALGGVLCAVGIGFLLFGGGDARLYVGVLALAAGGSTLLFGLWDVSQNSGSGVASE